MAVHGEDSGPGRPQHGPWGVRFTVVAKYEKHV
jgi:hypothetical protein